MTSLTNSSNPAQGVNEEQWGCEYCVRMYTNHHSFTEHCRSSPCAVANRGASMWKCPRCATQSAFKSTITKHMKTSCWVTCNECAGADLAKCDAGKHEDRCDHCHLHDLPCTKPPEGQVTIGFPREIVSAGGVQIQRPQPAPPNAHQQPSQHPTHQPPQPAHKPPQPLNQPPQSAQPVQQGDQYDSQSAQQLLEVQVSPVQIRQEHTCFDNQQHEREDSYNASLQEPPDRNVFPINVEDSEPEVLLPPLGEQTHAGSVRSNSPQEMGPDSNQQQSWWSSVPEIANMMTSERATLAPYGLSNDFSYFYEYVLESTDNLKYKR